MLPDFDKVDLVIVWAPLLLGGKRLLLLGDPVARVGDNLCLVLFEFREAGGRRFVLAGLGHECVAELLVHDLLGALDVEGEHG